jgi:hypothetical protein
MTKSLSGPTNYYRCRASLTKEKEPVGEPVEEEGEAAGVQVAEAVAAVASRVAVVGAEEGLGVVVAVDSEDEVGRVRVGVVDLVVAEEAEDVVLVEDEGRCIGSVGTKQMAGVVATDKAGVEWMRVR